MNTPVLIREFSTQKLTKVSRVHFLGGEKTYFHLKSIRSKSILSFLTCAVNRIPKEKKT